MKKDSVGATTPYTQTVSKIRLVKEKTEIPRTKITASYQAFEFAQLIYEGDMEVFESFYVLFLNRANIIMSYTKLSQGGISGTVVDTRLLMKYCFEIMASGIILVHNHPSGNTQPSSADKALTDKIKKIMDLMDISLLDHLIVTPDEYFSFADHGLLC